MKKVSRLTTLDELAEQLKVNRSDISKVVPKCAPEFAARKSKKLNQTEVDCIKQALKGK